MTEQNTETTPVPDDSTPPRTSIGTIAAGVLVVIALGAATRYLETNVPKWASGTSFAGVAKSIEFPVYAIAIGLLGNVLLTKLAVRDALSAGSAPNSSSRPAWCCWAPRST